MVIRCRRNQRGIALLVVLMGLALMTLIVVDFATESSLGYVSAATQANEIRAYYLARSGISFGLSLLAADARADAQSQTTYDALTDVWAVPFPTMPLEGGEAGFSIVDEARKINLNAIIDQDGTVNTDHLQIVERLLSVIGVDPRILPAIVDWIDADGIETQGGAEAEYYLALHPPYMPRNGPMPTIGDLKMVRGVNDAMFNRLREFVTVSPEKLVNANTAPPEVLAALDPHLMEDPKAVEAIIKIRQIQPFTKVTDIANLPDISSFGTELTKLLTVKSQYFTIAGMGTYAGARRIVNATFKRESNGIGDMVSWQEN
jgi:general secretion pathway protein K